MPKASRAAERPTILLVEDDGGIARVLARVLTAAGYTVLAMPSARQALDLVTRSVLRGARVDLMLSEVQLPGESHSGDGPACVASVRAARADLASLPAVFLSGMPRPEAQQRLRAAGIADAAVIEKPFETETLLEMVTAALAPPAALR